MRRIALDDEGASDPDVERMTAGERMAIVWQLTRQAWCFKEGREPEPRLRRDAVRTLRGRR